jgi:hypothetical protein
LKFRRIVKRRRRGLGVDVVAGHKNSYGGMCCVRAYVCISSVGFGRQCFSMHKGISETRLVHSVSALSGQFLQVV